MKVKLMKKLQNILELPLVPLNRIELGEKKLENLI